MMRRPCGELLIHGCFDELEESLETFAASSPHYVHFSKFRVPKGRYLVEVYAFVGSLTVNLLWDGRENGESLLGWWRATRPGQATPSWIAQYAKEDMVEDETLVSYLIRLAPAAADVPLPKVSEVANEYQWCSTFELRKPSLCPIGIKRRR
jgi:hypothetical protein